MCRRVRCRRDKVDTKYMMAFMGDLMLHGMLDARGPFPVRNYEDSCLLGVVLINFIITLECNRLLSTWTWAEQRSTRGYLVFYLHI